MAAVERMVAGVDGIIHLGGISGENEWPVILEGNIIGLYNVFEAARRAGVKRIVFATSNHAVGFYPRAEKIDHRVVPRPDSRYGVSKAFGEALASLYSDKHGIGVLCTRIGNFGEKPIDKRRLSIWISPRDYTQLVRIGLEHPDIRYEIVYGVSNNRRSWYDNSNAERLGYRPQDDSEPYAEAVLAAEPASRPTRSPSITRAARSAPPNTPPRRGATEARLQHRQHRLRRAAERGLAARDDDRPLDDDRVLDHRCDQLFFRQASTGRSRRRPPPFSAAACSPASSIVREAASAAPPYRASSNIRRSRGSTPFSRSNANVLREVLQRGLW